MKNQLLLILLIASGCGTSQTLVQRAPSRTKLVIRAQGHSLPSVDSAFDRSGPTQQPVPPQQPVPAFSQPRGDLGRTGPPADRPDGPNIPDASTEVPPADLATPGQTDKRPQPLSLRDAIRFALAGSEIVRTLSGDVTIDRATGFDPMIEWQKITQQESNFDPKFSTKYTGSQYDKPPSTFFGPGLSSPTLRDEGDFSISLSKRWQWGTTTSIGYQPPLAYLFLPKTNSSGFNPAYSSAAVFDLKQPLLRGGGRTANLAPIVIARTRADQTVWEVEEAMNSQVRSIEEAYWRLQAAYLTMQSIEAVLPLAEESVRIETLRFEAERITYSDVARAELKFESLRQQLYRAQLDVQQTEFNLRQLIGLPVHDETAIVPVDVPEQAEPTITLDHVVATALENRPDLLRRRLEVKANQIEVTVARNGLLPQLDFQAQLATNGLAGLLDDSLDQMSSLDYTDWTLGLTYSIPLGNRNAKAELARQELALARERALLVEYERQVTYQLASVLAKVETAWKRFQSARRQVDHAEEWLRLSRIRYQNPPVDKGSDWLLLTLADFQVAMQSHIDALTSAGQSLADYNTLLAELNEIQGTELERWRIQFDQPLPYTPPSPVPGFSDGHSLPLTPPFDTERNLAVAPPVISEEITVLKPPSQPLEIPRPSSYPGIPIGHTGPIANGIAVSVGPVGSMR